MLAYCGNVSHGHRENSVGHFLQLFLWYRENGWLVYKNVPSCLTNVLSIAGEMVAHHYWQWADCNLPIKPIAEVRDQYSDLIEWRHDMTAEEKAELYKAFERSVDLVLHDAATQAVQFAAEASGQTAKDWAFMANRLWGLSRQLRQNAADPNWN